MGEGDSKSDDIRKDHELHGRITPEPWLIKFLRKLRAPLVYGFRENPISDREFKENEALEETPEQELRELEEERYGKNLNE